MEKLFKLKGTFLDKSGNPAPEVFIAIADEDSLDEADLIGIGNTDSNGSFSISFLGSEFRQDFMELEETPDIFIVASAMFGEERKAIFKKEFPNLDWSSGEVDLGNIQMENVDVEYPEALEGVDPLPGHSKRAKRIDIDNDLVKSCLLEVAPIIEKLTGWKNLLDDVKVEVADSLTPYMLRETLLAEGKDPDSFESKFSAFMADFMQGPGAGCALYDPHIHTIVINRSIMEQVGIEGLKVICGHELVHLGQYKYTPGLKEYNLNHLRTMNVNPENQNQEELLARSEYMNELESYAKYIEEDFLKKNYYRTALMTYHASIIEKIMQALMAMAVEGTQESRDAKASQYTSGLDKFRDMQKGDKPAKFELDVSTLPGGEEFV